MLPTDPKPRRRYTGATMSTAQPLFFVGKRANHFFTQVEYIKELEHLAIGSLLFYVDGHVQRYFGTGSRATRKPLRRL